MNFWNRIGTWLEKFKLKKKSFKIYIIIMNFLIKFQNHK